MAGRNEQPRPIQSTATAPGRTSAQPTNTAGTPQGRTTAAPTSVPTGEVKYTGFARPAGAGPAGAAGATGTPFNEYVDNIASNQAPPAAQPFFQPQNALTAWNPAGPGFQPYTPPEGNGLNMMEPGAGEKRYENTKTEYDAPGAAETFWEQNAASFSAPGQGEQFAADANSRFGTGPNLSKDGGYGAYYDRAKERAVETLDASLAARGAYGSSVGLGQIGETISDLEADRARTEADYDLRRSETERGWLDSLAEIQSGAGRDRIDRISAGGAFAGVTDTSKQNRLRSGQDAANSAQDLQRERGQDYFDNNLKMGDSMSGLIGESGSGAMSNDQALMDSIISLLIGQGATGVSNATYWGQQGRDDSERLNDNIMNVMAAMRDNGGSKT